MLDWILLNKHYHPFTHSIQWPLSTSGYQWCYKAMPYHNKTLS